MTLERAATGGVVSHVATWALSVVNGTLTRSGARAVVYQQTSTSCRPGLTAS